MVRQNIGHDLPTSFTTNTLRQTSGQWIGWPLIILLDTTMRSHQIALCIAPLLPSLWVLHSLLSSDLGSAIGGRNDTTVSPSPISTAATSVGAQLLLFMALGIFGYVGTNRLIPSIKYYMLKRGISGKDLGKKGTPSENEDM